MGASEFTVEVFQNAYLAAGAREVNAIVTVTSAGSAADGHQATAGAASSEAMMRASMAKETGAIALRIWTPRAARVRFLKQVAPAIEDLTVRRTQAAPQAGDYPTGVWGAESRDYHVCVEVAPAAVY